MKTFGHGRGFDGGGFESQTCSDHRSRIDCGGHGQPQRIGPRMSRISRIQISDRLAWGLSVPSVKSVVRVLWRHEDQSRRSPNQALQATPVDASIVVWSRGSGVAELGR